MPFSRGSSPPSDQIWSLTSPVLAGGFFTTRGVLNTYKNHSIRTLWSEVTQSCPTLCHPMDCSYQAPLSMEFSRQEYWSGLSFPSPGIFPTQGSNLGLPHCRQTLYRLSHQGSPGVKSLNYFGFPVRRRGLEWTEVQSLVLPQYPWRVSLRTLQTPKSTAAQVPYVKWYSICL